MMSVLMSECQMSCHSHVRMSDVLSDVLPDGGEGTEDAEDVD